MLIDTVAFVQNNYRRPFPFGLGQRPHRADSAAELDRCRNDSRRLLTAMLASRK
jgi:hypothetical protein